MFEFAEFTKRVNTDAITDILKYMTMPGITAFSGGSPAAETFPVAEIKSIVDEALTKDAASILQYGSTGGRPELKKAYIEHMAKPKGVNVSEENLLVLTGSNQGIGLIADVLVNPGDTVLVESPTFLTTIMVLNKLGANCIPVQVDAQGMLPSDLEEKIKKYAPKFIYTIPTFQNPTGLTLPSDRREKIAQLAEKYEVIVVEDDPYCELRYKGETLPPIKSFDKKGYVVLLSSFSKIISPGLRVGVMAAHKDIISKATLAKQLDDTHSPNLNQVICAEFLNRGLLPAHLEKIKPLYAVRLEAMLDAIAKYFPKNVEYTKPEGGLFVWGKAPGDFDIKQVLERTANEEKVSFVPGAPFFINPQDGKNSFRLNFSSNPPEKIEEGIKKIGKILNEYVK